MIRLKREVAEKLLDGADPVEKMWRSFLGETGFGDEPGLNLNTIRMLFYAGATMMFEIMVSGVAPGDRAVRLERLKRIEEELDRFHEDVRAALGSDPHER